MIARMSETMQALLYLPSYELEIREVPSPRPAADEVLVRVEAAGICGSDLQGVASRSPRRTPPLIMGHELTGEVVAAGDSGGEALIGTRVAVNPQVPCGNCHSCRSGRENVCTRRQLIGGTRPGGFAELVSVPVRCVHPLSRDLPADVAVFCEPLATCVHALRVAPNGFAEVAVVLGAGTIGFLAVEVLRAAGAHVIAVSEVDEGRRERAATRTTAAVAPDELYDTVMHLTGGRGVSTSIDAVGSDSTRRESIRVLEPGGTAVWLGMHEQDSTIPAFELVVGEQRVQGSFAYTNPEFGQAVALLERGLISSTLSRRSVPLKESDDAFRGLLSAPADEFLKTIVRP
jgi:2-desacetyl-2-hydroxyethyl bacteriochlorophyllide A dehydrogenase